MGELVHLPDLQTTLACLDGTALVRRLKENLGRLNLAAGPTAPSPAVKASVLAVARKRLADAADHMVWAESAPGEDFLHTSALRALANRFSSTLPLPFAHK